MQTQMNAIIYIAREMSQLAWEIDFFLIKGTFLTATSLQIIKH